MKKQKKGIPAPVAFPELVCPHCGKPIETLKWRTYPTDGVGTMIGLVACGLCLKAIAGNVIIQTQEKK